MRYSLLLIALLVASGARSQTLAERVVGDWASADSIAYPVYDENGQQITGENGGEPFIFLYVHFSITESEIISTEASRSQGEVQGTESTVAYSLRGDSLYSEGSPPVGVAVRSDSLVVSGTGALGARTEYAYARAAPLAPPEALLGDWITEELTDNAGVVFDLPFRFRADGTVLVGHGEPLAYRVLGPYLLMYETEFVDPANGAVTTVFRVSRLDLREDRMRIQAPGGDPLVLYRR